MEQARRQLARQDKLRERGAISEEEVDQLRTELTVREARLQVKQAQIKEVEVRLNHAIRWLSRLQSGSPHSGGAASGPSLNNALIGTSSSSADHASPSRTSTTGSGLTGPSNQAKSPPDKSGANTSAGSSRPRPLNTLGNKLENSDTPGDSDQRIRNLEKRLERLMEQVDALRRDIRRQRPGGEGGTSAPADTNIKPADRPSQ